MSTKPWPHAAPTVPYVKGSDTSEAAAASMQPIAPTLRHKVYDYILGQGEQGATDDEVVGALGMAHRTATARRRELERMGAVYRTENRRQTTSGRTAGVYMAVPGANLNRRSGRPLKPPADALSMKLTVYITADQDRKLARMAKQQGHTKAKMARLCMGAGYQELASATRFYVGDTYWQDNG